jgi:hypothetical protein
MRAKRASSMDPKTIELKVVYCLEILPPTSEDLDQSLQIPGCVGTVAASSHRTIRGRKMLRVPNPNMGEPLLPGLLHREGASCQSAIPSLAATMTDVRARTSRAVRARASRADGQTWTSSACWHTRGQVLGVDLRQVPRQDSGRSTHALDHGTAQSRVSFLPQVDRQQLKPCVPTCRLASAGTNV